MIHRVGLLHTGEKIVLVGISSAHRGDAYHANEFIMDYLKSKAPFWKKEQTNKGDRWIEARDSDKEALKNGNKKAVDFTAFWYFISYFVAAFIA